MKLKNIAFSLLLLSHSLFLFAQDQAPANWFNLDITEDKVQGVSTEKSYKELLKGKKSTTVVVAILDSGVDEEHEDLKDVMWKNEDEIAGNGIDDDKNGYIDDVFGWNFIGGKDGQNVGADSYEWVRVYAHLKDKKRNAKEQAIFKKAQEQYEPMIAELKSNYESTELLNLVLAFLADKLGDKVATLQNIKAIEGTDDKTTLAKELGVEMLAGSETDTLDIKMLVDAFKEVLDEYSKGLNISYNIEFDPRKTIVGDNYSDSYEKFYGNNDVTGPDADHGTHVAGIVGAVRGNNTGMDGVADNVRLMAVRVVPDGDERDKDVANGIIYAVDNGAKIINMSFGKGFAFDKKAVDKAVKYAEQKGVLLVHAAGNSSLNIDIENNYPNKFPQDKRSKTYTNWIEVGALSWQGGVNAPADFSNYGKKSVDVFAPGVDIYATIPGSKYDSYSGTSMASPVTAGVAALVWSYYPELTVQELRKCIVSSVTKSFDYVLKPGTADEVEFKQLCNTSGIVNAYAALKMAESIVAGKK